MNYDVIIIGGGHAACEAALASARLGCKTLMLTINLDTIAWMPCNPAMGGPAKCQLVRETDALGGEIAKITDLTAIQVRILNSSKGESAQALRAQCDKKLYSSVMLKVFENQDNIDIKQAMVDEIIVKNDEVTGVKTNFGQIYNCKAIVLATGTFLKGKIFIGLKSFPAGRAGEFPSVLLSDSLRKLGFSLMRLKTGTPARVDKRTIDFSKMSEQKGDEPKRKFSFMDVNADPFYSSLVECKIEEQVSCYLTHTNLETHKIIMGSLDQSPMYSGLIDGVGPRYCPSIEDKVVRFKDKERHPFFLEPEGRDTNEIYIQGMSSSLPEDVYLKMIRSIEGMENVEILRPAYAVEYDYMPATQLNKWLETKTLKGLFCAGQINGTSGYEEAASQGLIAGINAAHCAQNKKPFILDRSSSYIGTLIDDLVTKEIRDPYRMLTSRSEYRLILRHDNADLRLTPLGHEIGLVTKERYEAFLYKSEKIKEEMERLDNIRLKPTNEMNEKLKDVCNEQIRNVVTLSELLRRTPVNYEIIKRLSPPPYELSSDIIEQIELGVKYHGYITRQLDQIERDKKYENRLIPPDLDYYKITSLSRESQEKLSKIKPLTLGQASRVGGVTPSDVSVLLVYLKFHL